MLIFHVKFLKKDVKFTTGQKKTVQNTEADSGCLWGAGDENSGAPVINSQLFP